MKHYVMSLNMKPITLYGHNQVTGENAHSGELVLEMRSTSGDAYW